jgi:hypothetical protein
MTTWKSFHRRYTKKTKARKTWKLLNLWNLYSLLGILGIVFVLMMTTIIIIQQSKDVPSPDHQHRFFQEKPVHLQRNDITLNEISRNQAIQKPLSSSSSSPKYQSIRQHTQRSKRQYADWRRLAVELSALLPSDLIKTLEQKDPFGVRNFEKKLLKLESENHGPVSLEQIRQELFPCPHEDRISLPDVRNHSQSLSFRHRFGTLYKQHDTISNSSTTTTKSIHTFLFFQHLRKAGGTNFCSLAKANLPPKSIPSYYCMPDMDWSNQKCAGCLSHYTSQDIQHRMNTDSYSILGNEWDPFDAERYFNLDAVFATSFRKPLDRALSQFRFECIEDRGCTTKRIEEFWTQHRDALTNVYTWTFTKEHRLGKLSHGNSSSSILARQNVVGKALDVLVRFHLIVIMEWLAYAKASIEQELGFQDTSALIQRIRPHISQAKRNDGQDINNLGAAGIAKASWDPKSYLSPSQYRIMSEDLALDELLNDAARRIFLERLVC